ncbi:hypothetical protein [Spongiactinospora sp. TRM90649]|uniref:hypothetical protein n=1 Tax=Spongiactinospora sp. TRM90649 TaxID=3031114 RepID=UPI0023F76376|nr:hypothetical protein [Spongiactinospora sp. TRM90649]MDF5753133.1 hypothetical protein [Spongiactinospora sp. TRM90649]
MSRIDDLTRALPRLVTESARRTRLATATRADLRKALIGRHMRRLADADPELGTHLTRAADALAQRSRDAEAWQKGLTAATNRWKAALTELSQAHHAHPARSTGTSR